MHLREGATRSRLLVVPREADRMTPEMLPWTLRLRAASVLATLTVLLSAASTSAQPAFVNFESGPGPAARAVARRHARCSRSTRPTTGSRSSRSARGGLTHTGSVPVGLEPVAVAARTDTEVWVVNHLSDSVSIVDVASSPPRVVAHAARRRRAARHRLRRHRAATAPSSRPRTAARTAPRRPAAHDRGRRPRRRLGVRRDEPRHDARRHAAHDRDAVRRHAARARGERRRQHGLRGGLPLRQPDDGAHRGRRLRRRRAAPAPCTVVGLDDAGRPARRRTPTSQGIAGPEVGLIVKFDAALRRSGRTSSGATGTTASASRCPTSTCSRSTPTPRRRRRSQSFARRRHRRSSTWS